MVDFGDERATGAWLVAAAGGVGALGSWTAADGRIRLVSSGTDGTIQIWDPERGEAIGQPISGHTDNVFRLVPHGWRGGTMLASAGEDGVVRIWDVSSDEPTCIALTGHHGWVKAVAFWTGTAGTPRLASAATDGTVRIWDPRSGEQLGPPLLAGSIGVGALAAWFTSGGSRLAVADDAGNITVWDPDSRTPQRLAPMCHRGGIWTSLAVWTAPDGTTRLASGGQDGAIIVWNAATGERMGEPLRGHTGWVPAIVAWNSPGAGTVLASAGTDGTVRVWDGDSGVPLDMPLGRIGGALAALTTWVGPDGRRRLTYVGPDGALRSYDVATGMVRNRHPVRHVAGVWALANWPDTEGTRLARGGDDAVIRIFNADTGQTVGAPLGGHTTAVWAMATWRADDGTVMVASAGDDGTIRTWDATACAATGEPMITNSGWVIGLATWHRPNGCVGLASASADGAVRRWDPVRYAELGGPLRGHHGGVMAVVGWPGRDGARLATAGADGTVRLWDPDIGVPVREPLAGHTDWVRALAIWQGADRTLLVSGGYDGAIRIWDGETGAAVGEPLAGPGRVGALTVWTEDDGGARLAAAGDEGTIRIFDLQTREPVGTPLVGHGGGIWALTSWRGRDGVRLASAGQDGSVRLWDPRTGHALRTIEIGPVTMWGISDTPTKRDVIGRQALANAIADQMRVPAGATGSLPADGPTVVSVEGPWGCGKSTLMNLVRERLLSPASAATAKTGRRMTVRAVLREIRGLAARPGRGQPVAQSPTAALTAWFNPWQYQSGEQIWAGLANEIIEAAADVLYPTEPARERYWLVRNLERIDRYALRRALHQRIRSPILGLATVALIAPLVLALTQLDRRIGLLGVMASPFQLAIGVALLTLLAGAVHMAWRYAFGKAVDYVPAGMLNGPVLSTLENPPDSDADPLHRARAGALYLHQHSIGDLIDDLAAAGYDLVVFVDDIDRCRPGTIAEVFEAINLFLSNVASRSGLRAHFVVGLDPAVVASHLDVMYAGGTDPNAALHGDDPTPGWAFLRKLIQLPVLVPAIPDEGVRALVDSITRPGATTPPDPPAVRPAQPAAVPPAKPVTGPPPPQHPPLARLRMGAPRAPVDTFAWHSAERHPEVRSLLVRRMSEQPQRSIREAKRLINLWQFYERIMEVEEPLTEPSAMVVRARQLLILAEIVSRWPALQRRLHRHLDGRRGLQLLASAAAVDEDWQRAVALLGFPPGGAGPALDGLRELLRAYQGRAVADLAARLM